MQLIPPVQEVTVQRGSTGSFNLTIRNDGDEDVPSRFTPHDLDINDSGRPFIPDSGAVRGCGGWIKLEPDQCVIKAHESILVTGTISVPKNAEGGYYCLIKGSFTDMTIPLSGEKANIEGSKIGLRSEAVVAVLFTVPSSRNKAEIVPETLFVYPRGGENQSVITTDFGAKKGWEVIMPVRNDGNIHTRVSGQASIYSENGTRFGSAPFEAGKGYVLPGKVRNLKATGESILSDGYYMLRIALQTSERANMSNSFAFSVYKGEVYPGAVSDEIAKLLKASSPGFSLKEPFKEKKVTAGGSTFLPIMLMNTVTDTLTLIPRKIEWNLSPIGQPTLGNDSATQPRSCSSWIEFVDDKIVLPPGRSGSFKLKINSPSDIAGEYYSAVVFDQENMQKNLPPEFMAARTQLIALQSPKGLDYQVEIDSVKVKKETTPELTLHRFLFRIRNTGNVRCYAMGSMSFEKEVAKEIYKPAGNTENFGDNQTFILPGGERAFEIDVPNMEPGKYRIILTVSYMSETQPKTIFQRVKLN